MFHVSATENASGGQQRAGPGWPWDEGFERTESCRPERRSISRLPAFCLAETTPFRAHQPSSNSDQRTQPDRKPAHRTPFPPATRYRATKARQREFSHNIGAVLYIRAKVHRLSPVRPIDSAAMLTKTNEQRLRAANAVAVDADRWNGQTLPGRGAMVHSGQAGFAIRREARCVAGCSAVSHRGPFSLGHGSIVASTQGTQFTA